MVQLKLRFPEALRRRLEREAKRRGLSLNAEIVRILERAYQQSDDMQRRAKAIANALGYQIVDAIIEQAKKQEEHEARGAEEQFERDMQEEFLALQKEKVERAKKQEEHEARGAEEQFELDMQEEFLALQKEKVEQAKKDEVYEAWADEQRSKHNATEEELAFQREDDDDEPWRDV
jgi:hypothetical protein